MSGASRSNDCITSVAAPRGVADIWPLLCTFSSLRSAAIAASSWRAGGSAVAASAGISSTTTASPWCRPFGMKILLSPWTLSRQLLGNV